MPIETATDLASFFNTNEHAETANWTLKGGVKAWPVSVIVDQPDEAIDVTGVPVRLPERMVQVQLSELPTGYGKGDMLDLGSDFYTVERIDKDQTRTIGTVFLRVP